MDVRCNRCGTDYEFDDALISDRGTTVQCTNCGYQFKIYPERTAVASPERWVVHTMSGKELVYTSLRDLQRAIGEHKVGPKDLLSRGAQASRPLGSIPELEPFFTSTAGQSHGMQTAPRTLHGVAPPPSGAPRPPAAKEKQTQRGFGLPGAGRDVGGLGTTQKAVSGEFAQRAPESRILGIDPTAATERQPQASDEPPAAPPAVAPTVTTKIGMGSTQRSGTPPDLAQGFSPTSTVRIESKSSPPSFDSTLPAASPPRAPEADPNAQTALQTAPGPRPEPRARDPLNFDATMPVPSQPGSPVPRMYSERAAAAFAAGAGPSSPLKSSPRAAPTPEPPPISTRERLPSYDDLAENVDPARRARSRWIAGVVFLAVAGLLGATLGRQYLVRLSTGRKTEPVRSDDRALRFLQEGMRLLDQADYDGAQEQLAKAQALSDRDPTVLAGLARLETVRADAAWLRLRLLDPTGKDAVQTATRELTRRAGRARQAVDTAFAVAADDPIVVRSRIDAMRIAGEETKAREWISPIAANASDPQNAYVLAALDLSEAAPAFGTVIDRLRAAAVSEHESLRARGALIYALVRAGRVVEAETELSKVTGGEHPHPLADELRSFVGRFSAPLDGGVSAPAVSGSAAAPLVSGAAAAPAGERAPGAAEALPGGDFRTRLMQAAQASARGDLGRATELYQSVVNEQPGNTEALSGLADVARRRGDGATAARLYARVLDANPSYLPALMAVADQKWSSGDHKGALSLYKRVVEQAGPASEYGQRAQARIRETESASTATPTAAPAAPRPTATASPSPVDTADLPGRSRPDIDTTDLPGVKAP
jgi:predicted Zn finger-like uncharacterized protein